VRTSSSCTRSSRVVRTAATAFMWPSSPASHGKWWCVRARCFPSWRVSVRSNGRMRVRNSACRWITRCSPSSSSSTSSASHPGRRWKSSSRGKASMSPTEARLEPRRITILPTAVADGIAAGEVVDRPAAVVKELVENAIDAGAARIQVRIEAAGQRLIEVVDDGIGMAPADMRLAFLRHATSKIRSLDDLQTIQTLGFRGEALASIAAVSRVEAVSRPRDGGGGYRVLVEGGLPVDAGPAGSPVGARVSVSRLFFNTPARLKFLKQPATEHAVIARLVGELALANPSIGIALDVDRR